MNKDLDDLLTRARAFSRDVHHLDKDFATAGMLDELIAEIERLRPLAELWDALSHELRVRGILSVEHSLGPKPFEVYSAALNEAVRGRTLPEAVRALLEEAERG